MFLGPRAEDVYADLDASKDLLVAVLRAGAGRDHHPAVGTLDLEHADFTRPGDPDISLVTDTATPGSSSADGLTLLTYMNDHYPEIPCVVMSAHGTPQIREKISSDVLKFIERPFEIEELVETILPTLEGGEPGGMMKGISIANFLQMIHMEQKTCLLEMVGLTSSEKRKEEGRRRLSFEIRGPRKGPIQPRVLSQVTHRIVPPFSRSPASSASTKGVRPFR